MSYIQHSIDPARTYVGFSAGKDSAVIAHACARVWPSVPIAMVDPGVPTHWLEEERQEWVDYAATQGWRLEIFPWDKWGDLGIATAKDAASHADAAHRSMFADLYDWAAAEGRDHYVMGLRADESRGRKLRARRYGLCHEHANGRTSHTPIAWWSTDDVWCYIIKHGLPWLTIYDHLGPDARNGLIGRNGLQNGRLAYLRKYYPAAFRAARDQLGFAWIKNNA